MKYLQGIQFSPMPTYLMGHPVTAFTERAAPPRSPSNLVNITPVSPNCQEAIGNRCIRPVMASTINNISSGLTWSLYWPTHPLVLHLYEDARQCPVLLCHDCCCGRVPGMPGNTNGILLPHRKNRSTDLVLLIPATV